MLVAEEVILKIIEHVGPLTQAISRQSRSLADQADRAADSIALNYAEGIRRENRDRTNRLGIAIGSADEPRMALRLLYGLMRPQRAPGGPASR